jgi:hypothetical protein
VVEVVFATVDHSDIRGSKPHNRDPSGVASDYKRGFGPKTYRIELSRILLSVYPSTTTHAASFEFNPVGSQRPAPQNPRQQPGGSFNL